MRHGCPRAKSAHGRDEPLAFEDEAHPNRLAHPGGTIWNVLRLGLGGHDDAIAIWQCRFMVRRGRWIWAGCLVVALASCEDSETKPSDNVGSH